MKDRHKSKRGRQEAKEELKERKNEKKKINQAVFFGREPGGARKPSAFKVSQKMDGVLISNEFPKEKDAINNVLLKRCFWSENSFSFCVERERNELRIAKVMGLKG